MKVLTASAPSHLKLALHTTTNNEFSEAPDYAYVEISAAEARALIDLIGLAQNIRRQTEERGLIATCYDICFGLGRSLPLFRLIPLPFAEDAEPDGAATIVVLPEDFDPETLGDRAEHRVECHRVEVGHDTVRFSAIAKHGDDRFVTATLSEVLLQKIADGQMADLPLARMLATDAGE